MPAVIRATLDSRYSFTAQFLRGAGIFAKRAREIESSAGSPASEEITSEHRALVVAAIMQSSAALEAEISEVADYGPGHHLGSNGVDASARDYLSPIAEFIDDQQTLARYQIVLHSFAKRSLPLDGNRFNQQPCLFDCEMSLSTTNRNSARR